MPLSLATAALAGSTAVALVAAAPTTDAPTEESQPLSADAAVAGDAATRPVATPVGDPTPAPMSPAQPTAPQSLPEGAVPTAHNPAATQLEQVTRWEWLGHPLAPKTVGVTGKRRNPHRFLPLPSLRSQPSVGLMLGASLNYAYRTRDEEPNRIYLFLEARVSLRKVQQHGFFVRLRDLLGHKEIFEIGAGAMIDPVFPYFGLANHHNLSGENLQSRHYQLKLSTFGGFFTYQHPVWTYRPSGPRPIGTLRSYTGFGYFVDRIQPYQDTLFAAERSSDAGLTRRGVLRLGLIWDRRDNDWSPRTGALHDVTVDSAGPWTGSTHAWGRVHATFRHYWQLGVPSLVFAHRLTYDGLWGDPPFATLGEFGGLAVSDAIGGQAVGRGWMRRRFIGRHKAYASAELRFEPIELKIGKHTLGLGLKAYVDLGLVAERLRDLPLHFQVSGGPGILLVWDRFAVIRLDGGFSRELKAFYLMTEHAF